MQIRTDRRADGRDKDSEDDRQKKLRPFFHAERTEHGKSIGEHEIDRKQPEQAADPGGQADLCRERNDEERIEDRKKHEKKRIKKAEA